MPLLILQESVKGQMAGWNSIKQRKTTKIKQQWQKLRDDVKFANDCKGDGWLAERSFRKASASVSFFYTSSPCFAWEALAHE